MNYATGYLHAVDPGTANAGMATALDGRLVAAVDLRYPSAMDYAKVAAPCPGVWVRERMQKYNEQRAAHRNLDDIEALMDALVALTGQKFAETYLPLVWKGQVPKPACHRRIRRALDAQEQTIFDNCGPDGRDAIGILLFALGRTSKGGTAK